MFATIWKELGEGFGKRWLLTTFAPVVGLLGASLWIYVEWRGLPIMLQQWAHYSSTQQTALLIAALGAAAVAAYLLELFTMPLLRLYEGYWGEIPGLRRLGERRRARWAGQRVKKEARWRELALKEMKGEATPEEMAERRRLDVWLARMPADAADMLPTLFGNLLRGAEGYPDARYGLEAVVVWPRLYPSLPDELKETLSNAREGMSALSRLSTLALLFSLIWVSTLALHRAWALAAWCLLGLIVAWFAYQGAVQSAALYGDLIRAAFDRHRFDLYAALHWPAPLTLGHEERTAGRALTLFLFRGQGSEGMRYTHAPTPEDKKE